MNHHTPEPSHYPAGAADNSLGTAAPTLATLLQQARMRAGLSQAELAERAGLSVAAIAAIEQGQRRHPYPHTLRQLADALGLTGEMRAALLATVPRRRSAKPRQATPSEVSAPTHAPRPSDAADAHAPDRPTADRPTADRPTADRPALAELPTPLTLMFGREEDVALVSVLLRRGARLVTLTGPGGVGKTRLSVAVAGEALPHFADGVAFVPLAPLADPALVLPTIAQAVGVRESGEPLHELVRRALQQRHLLLVLDNCEHVLEAAAIAVGTLLQCCRDLVILATSRAPLRIQGEQEYPVTPLTLPAFEQMVTLDEAERSPAVRLFVERAQASHAAFALTAANASTVAAICGRLDGLPLALELAAARIKLLAPTALLERLHHTLPLLTGGARDLPARQQTLSAAIAWSYNLLDPSEQALFRGLAVFAGGCTLDAVQAICLAVDLDAPLERELRGDDGNVLELIGSLTEKSLLQVRELGGETRVAMLETIREYALEQAKASGELDAWRQAHAVYYTSVAQAAETQLTGPEQSRWFERLERDHDNLRAALAWALERGQTELGQELGAALGRFWWMRGHFGEGYQWLAGLLALASAAEASVGLYCRTLQWAGILAACTQGNQGQAVPLLEQAVALCRAGGDVLGAARALSHMAQLTYDRGERERGVRLFEETLALARQAGDRGEVARALGNLGEAVYHQGDLTRAVACYEEALTLAQQVGRVDIVAIQTANLGNGARRRGDLARASALTREALELNGALGNRKWMAVTLEYLAQIAAAEGHADRAGRLLGIALTLRAAMDAPVPPPEVEEINRAVRTARATLGEARWQAAVVAGRALSLPEAIAYALEKVHESPHA